MEMLIVGLVDLVLFIFICAYVFKKDKNSFKLSKEEIEMIIQYNIQDIEFTKNVYNRYNDFISRKIDFILEWKSEYDDNYSYEDLEKMSYTELSDIIEGYL